MKFRQPGAAAIPRAHNDKWPTPAWRFCCQKVRDAKKSLRSGFNRCWPEILAIMAIGLILLPCIYGFFYQLAELGG